MKVLPDQGQQAPRAVESFQERVDVGQNQADADGVLPVIKEEAQVRVEDISHLPSRHFELVIRHGHEAPVLRPALHVDAVHQPHFHPKALGVHVSDGHVSLLGQFLGHVAHPSGRLVIAGEPIGEEILLLPEAAEVGQFHVVGRVVRHHETGRGVEALDEQPDLIIGGRIERPPQEAHAFGSRPAFRRPKKRRSHFRIAGAFEESPRPHPFSVILVVIPVHNGRNPAHRLRAAGRQEELPLGAFPKGVLPRGEQGSKGGFDGRDPVRIALINAPGQLDECFEIRSSSDGSHLQTAHTPPLASWNIAVVTGDRQQTGIL